MEHANGRELAPGIIEAGTAEIDIPANALIACPLLNFQLRSPRDCPTCQHCIGLSDRFPGSTKTFAERFLIMCRGEVKPRQVHTIAVR